jgi:hypothetical protein
MAPHPKLVEYTNLIANIPKPIKTPIFQSSGRLIICLIEFRKLEEIQWVINAVLRVYPLNNIGLAIVYGTLNAEFVENKFRGWKNLKFIRTEHENLNRGTYSALLKTPEFYENFIDFSHVLIYQTDALILKQISEEYFEFHYIGAPWSLKNQCAPVCAGNGGFSLRNVKAMIRVCEENRGKKFENIHRGNEDIFFCSQKSLIYPQVNTEEHKRFAVERVYHPEPIGGHQLYLCTYENGKWEQMVQYIKRQLFEDSLITIPKNFVAPLPNLIYPQNIQEIYKKSIPAESTEALTDLVVNKLVQLNETEHTEISVGPFRMKLIHKAKHQWTIACEQNYEICFCKNQSHETCVFKKLIDKEETATIHKKEKGVWYYQLSELSSEVYIVFSGFPNGGGCWADINISDGQKYAKGLPKNGSIILRSTMDTIEKYIPLYSQKESLLNNLQDTDGETRHKLVFHLYSGVGFYNQLFSLELAIYFASLSNRHLVLYIAHPLVDAGRADRSHGILLDYLTEDYLRFLPMGITVIKYDSSLLSEHEKDSHLISLESKTSNTVFVDDELNTRENRQDILDFANNRLVQPFSKLDYIFDATKKTVSFKNSNAARINTGFYTHTKNYKLISNIMKSVSTFIPVIEDIAKEIHESLNIEGTNLISLHLRFGDIYKKSSQIGVENNIVAENIVEWVKAKFPNKDKDNTFLIMCDRKDSTHIFDSICRAGSKVIFTDNLLSEEHTSKLKELFKNPNVASFCVQKTLCEYNQWFLFNYGSTVSVSSAYKMWLQGKEWELFANAPCSSFNKNTLKLDKQTNFKYSWKQRNASQSHTTAWAYFSPDNLIT